MGRYVRKRLRGDMSMGEEDVELLERIRKLEEFSALCELLDREDIDYNELDLAKQYEMIHSPFAVFESE